MSLSAANENVLMAVESAHFDRVVVTPGEVWRRTEPLLALDEVQVILGLLVVGGYLAAEYPDPGLVPEYELTDRGTHYAGNVAARSVPKALSPAPGSGEKGPGGMTGGLERRTGAEVTPASESRAKARLQRLCGLWGHRWHDGVEWRGEKFWLRYCGRCGATRKANLGEWS